MTVDLPTLRSRQLGMELRRIRLRAGYQANHMAKKLGWDPSRVSKLEHGVMLLSDPEVVNYLARALATPEEVNEAMVIQRSIGDMSYMECHWPGYRDQLRSLDVLEQEEVSDSITSYDVRSIPDLLQTEDYMRATLAGCGLPSGDLLEKSVKKRLSRQQLTVNILKRSRFFVHERALCLKVHGSNLMYEQLNHIAIMAAASQCEVRVLPEAAVDFPVNFRVYGEGGHWIAVAVETPTATLFLSGKEDFATYGEVLAAIEKTALGVEESISRINALADQSDTLHSPS